MDLKELEGDLLGSVLNSISRTKIVRIGENK